MKREGNNYFSDETSVAAAATVAASAIAEEEEYEADGDNNPDVFTVKKVTQAVHSGPPFGVNRISLP